MEREDDVLRFPECFWTSHLFSNIHMLWNTCLKTPTAFSKDIVFCEQTGRLKGGVDGLSGH